MRTRTSTSSCPPTSTRRSRFADDSVRPRVRELRRRAPRSIRSAAFLEWRRVLQPDGTSRPRHHEPREPVHGARRSAAGQRTARRSSGAVPAPTSATCTRRDISRIRPSRLERGRCDSAGFGRRGELVIVGTAAPLRSSHSRRRQRSCAPSSACYRRRAVRRSSPRSADGCCSECCKSLQIGAFAFRLPSTGPCFASPRLEHRRRRCPASPQRPRPRRRPPLFPGVTYENGVQFTPHGPVAIRRRSRPEAGRAVPAADRALERDRARARDGLLDAAATRDQATMVGVNGDFSRFADGQPERDHAPRRRARSRRRTASASSVGIGLDGMLDVRRVALSRHLARRRDSAARSTYFNDAPGKNGIALFTSRLGSHDPADPRLATRSCCRRSPRRCRTPTSSRRSPRPRRTPRSRIAPGTAGARRARQRGREAPGRSSGRYARSRCGSSSSPTGRRSPTRSVAGLSLVRDGRPVYRANEAFTSSQIAPRHPRTAIGQLADGRILLVVVDGRQPGYSVGMTTFEMALTMVRLGAVRAMQLDGGGSSTLAFEGTVLNSPSDGRERPISTALMLQYYGVYAPPPLEAGRLAERRRRRGDAGALVQGRAAVDDDRDAHRARRVDRMAGSRRARASRAPTRWRSRPLPPPRSTSARRYAPAAAHDSARARRRAAGR